MTDKHREPDTANGVDGAAGADQDRRHERPQDGSDRQEPGPPKKVGDESPNPLPDDPSEGDGGAGGDPGRA